MTEDMSARAFDACVVGAGVFGAWTALQLQREGANVLLLDQGRPTHPSASSGGAHRLMRAVYGNHHHYVRWAAAARPYWESLDSPESNGVLEPVGVLWLVDDQDYPGDCIDACRSVGVEVRELEIDEARKRYPHVSFDIGVSKVYLEGPAGFLRAAEACRATIANFEKNGGVVRTRSVRPGAVAGGKMTALLDDHGRAIEAGQFVFACGPWLPEMFPREIGELIAITRQVEHQFEIPMVDELPPACIDFGSPIFYGLCDIENDGGTRRCLLKVGEDTRGMRLRSVADLGDARAEDEARVRHLLAKRFPAFQDARCRQRRACMYSNTPTGDYLIDRHPEAENAWFAGGGSSHAFKMGPMVGKLVAELATGDLAKTPPRFSLKAHRHALTKQRAEGEESGRTTVFD